MKTSKKILAVLLSALLCLGCLLLPVSAADALPESDHPYADGIEQDYTYTYPGAADGFFITFSEDTFFEKDSFLFYGKNGQLLDLTTEEVLAMDDSELFSLVYDIEYKEGDLLQIFAGSEYLGYYDGDDLAGKTLYIPGNTVTMTLISDDSVSGYGFAVDAVSDKAPDGVYTVTYDLDGRSDYIDCFGAEEEASVMSAGGIMNGAAAVKAWSLTKGGEAVYDGGEALTLTGNLVLYPVYTDILLTSDEVFSFDNEFEPFAVNRYGEDEDAEITDYYMNDEDYTTMISNLYRVGALAAAGSMLSYTNSEWGGSCYGMSLAVALQHCGMLDLLRYQDGASTVNELAPSPELISCINYYQAQEYPASMVQNSADFPGTYKYTYQLQKMYNEVRNGHIVLFGFYENHSFDSVGHAILLTGAYDDLEGNHILLAYDCNYGSWYDGGIATRYIISPDFSSMTSEIYGDIIGFDWLSDFSCFEAFDIDGNGSTMSWFKSIINHIRDFFDMIASFFRSLFGR